VNRLFSLRNFVGFLMLATDALALAAGCGHNPRTLSHPANPTATQAAVRNDFVGSAACAECHRRETMTHETSRHATTLHTMERRRVSALVPQTGRIPGTEYKVTSYGNGLALSSMGKVHGPLGSTHPLDLAFGSGKTGMTDVAVLNDDSLMESRMSYFPRMRKW